MPCPGVEAEEIFFCVNCSLELCFVLWLLYESSHLHYTIFRAKSSSKGGGGTMDAKAVGQRIKAAREKKSMTQEDLAARINISPTHVSVIERGTKIPRIDTFVAIANVLEVSADELLVDVVDRAATGVASNLSAVIEVLPHEEKMRVLKVVSALIDR
jgi:hypothetical protein